MNAPLSLPSIGADDILDKDTMMRRVAREVAMDIQSLDQILQNCDISQKEFDSWKEHPQFQRYLMQFKDEWNAAANTHERTKIKASIVMEEFMEEAYRNLHNAKQPLNHRVELGKLVAKIAGMGEPKVQGNFTGGPSFNLSINIGGNDKVTITNDTPRQPKIIENAPSVAPRSGFDSFEEIEEDDPVYVVPSDEDEDYDPLAYPNTLEDE